MTIPPDWNDPATVDGSTVAGVIRGCQVESAAVITPQAHSSHAQASPQPQPLLRVAEVVRQPQPVTSAAQSHWIQTQVVVSSLMMMNLPSAPGDALHPAALQAMH